MAANAELESIRKSQIITAAIAMIAEAGISNVTMDDIAEASGMSKGGIAHYFSSKDALFKAAFKEFFDRIFIRSKETMDRYAEPMDQLLSFSWLYDRSDPDSEIGYPLLFDCMSMAVHDEGYRNLFHEWVDNWITLLKAAITAGQSRGMFAGLDPESTARAISSIYHGIAVRWYLDKNFHPTAWAVESFTHSITRLLGE